jgi:hypothetical protein
LITLRRDLFSQRFARVDCVPALATKLGAALRMAGLPE